MANREYEMLFKLGARLNQNFSGTFNSAQKVLAATQKEIQALNRLQSDVNGYQRQQTSIDKTNDRLNTYRNQLEHVRQEMAQTGSSSSDLKNREEELEFKIRQTEQTIAEKSRRLSELGEALTAAGVDVSALTSESERLQQELSDLRSQEDAAAVAAQDLANSSTSAFEAAGSALVAAGIAEGLREIYDAYKECVSISMEFGSTMSTVEALSGASVSEMQQLTAKAKELGASTAYTANQSAEAMTYMGMAGWNAGQMISGMDGMMALAAASGEDLGMVSDIVTDNLTAFKLEAADTSHFVDVLAAAATNSNTSVGVMGETFKSSASIAGALGYSIEDVAIAVGAMANSGVKGSIAGTALKNIFNGISGEITLTSKAFGEATYTGVNLDGSMKSLSETIDDLRVYFDQMTDSEKKANAQAIAGERGYNGLLAILGTTDEQYAELAASINECTGAAQRMANIKLDNLKGDVTLLQSTADGLKMSVGELYDDELRKLAQIGTEILSGINDFVEKNPTVVKSIMAVAAEIGVVLIAYNAFNTAKKVKNALDTLGAVLEAKKAAAATAAAAATGAEAAATTGAAAAQTGLNTAMLASPIFIITAAVAALTVGLTALREACKVEALETQTLNTATQEQTDRVSQLTDEYERACETYGATSDKARALKYDLDEATASVEAQQFSVKELYAELDTLQETAANVVGSYRDSTKEIDDQHERAAILIAKLKELGSTSENTSETQTQMEAIIKELNKQFPELGLNIENVTGNIDDMMSKVDQAWRAESRQAKHDAAQSKINDLTEQEAKLQAALVKAEKVQRKASDAYVAAVGDNIFSAAGGLITGKAQQTEADLDKANAELAETQEALRAVQEAIADCRAEGAEYAEIVSGTSSDVVSAYDGMSIAISDVKAKTEELLAEYNEAYEAAYESINGQYSLWDEAARVIPTSIGTINTALDTQYEYWNDYNTSLTDLLSRAEDIDGLKEILATFADGSEESVNAIAGMAAASDEDLKKMVENFQKLKDQQAETSTSIAELQVDFETRMDKIQTSLEDSIVKMNMDGEARKAAEATITAYIDTIASYKGSATEAAQAVSSAVTNALGVASGSVTASTPKVMAGGDYVRGFHQIDGYANGTDYAEAGVKLVGENGPELAFFNGGERVVPTQQSQAMLRDYNRMIDYAQSANAGQAYVSAAAAFPLGNNQTTQITVSPQFVFNGSDSEQLREQAEDITERIWEMIAEKMDERENNARRGAYV